MSPLTWRLCKSIALALPRPERDAVLGDLLESGHPTPRILYELTTLALRRSARHLAAPFLVLPLAVLLSVLARSFADMLAVYLWFWTNNLDPHLLRTPPFWRGIAECAPHLLLATFTLCLWSWSCATLATRLSRPAALLFGTALLLATAFGPPAFLATHLSLVRARDFPGNAPVFTSAFYRNVFPALVQILAVLAPALLAIRPTQTETAR